MIDHSKITYTVEPIGVIRSALIKLDDAPKQGDEGGYEAWLELASHVAPALTGVKVGDRLLILTWLHLAQRETLQVHPRNRLDVPLTGVFATRSPDRPNPIGLHEVSVLAVEEYSIKVAPLEAINGTPIIDIKPVLGAIDNR